MSNTGGPAFPSTATSEGSLFRNGCMSLRDYFAGQALQGMLGSIHKPDERLSIRNNTGVIAEVAYKVADSMLEERGRQ